MPRNELFDPAIPQFDHRIGSRGFRRYKVAEVGECVPDDDLGWGRIIRLTSDGGVGLPDLAVSALDTETVDGIVSMVRQIAELEATAYGNYRIGDRKRGKAGREQAARAREILMMKHNVRGLPAREWDFGDIVPITASQLTLF